MTKTVAILLAARNGERHLSEQLLSIAAQKHTDWQLWVGDDGSTDATRAIVADFGDQVDQPVHVLDGPCQGVAANALALLKQDPLPRDAAVAFCDQDDIWYPHHLSDGLAALEGHAGPALYCARTDIGPDAGIVRTQSPLWPREPSFANALIQSIAGANTMMLNPAAADLARRAATGPVPAYHDWWLYGVVSGAGGQILYDPKPAMLYRQHDENQLGRNRGFAARYARIATIGRGQYRDWVTQNTEALMSAPDVLTAESRELAQAFMALRDRRGLPVLAGWRKLGVHRQSSAETAIMAAAAACGLV